MKEYWSDPVHQTWQESYFQIGRDCFLAFSSGWAKRFLPKSSTSDLLCLLLDVESGVEYEVPIYVAYQEYNIEQRFGMYDYPMVQDEDWNSCPHSSLQSYFYQQHHCPCHRHHDAVRAGLQESRDDFECKGNRFEIVRIFEKSLPELILYSETMKIEDLNEKLRQTK